MANTLTSAQFSKFLALANSLSPENLHMDGEATREEVASQLCAITRAWQKLELEVGFKVTEDEVWSQYSSAENHAMKEEAMRQFDAWDRATSEANERGYGGTVD